MKILYYPLLFVLIAMSAYSDEIKMQPTRPREWWHAMAFLKTVFGCRVLGVEMYSPLALPKFDPKDSRTSVLEKLRNAGFDVVERDGIVNLTDAKSRPTGKTPYPFAQHVKITAGTHRAKDLLLIIEKQINFKIETLALGAKVPHFVKVDFAGDTVLSVREILNLVADKAKNFWLVERSSFALNMSDKAGEYVRTDHPILGEHDSSVLYVVE